VGFKSLLDMKSDTISILKTLSREENRKFKTFLASKYFSHNKNVSILFRELVKFYPTYVLTADDKNTIFSRIYKLKKYNDSTFRSLMHNLLHVLQDFIVIESLSKKHTDKRLLLLGVLYKRGEAEVFNKELNNLNDEFKDKTNELSADNLFIRYKLSLFNYNFEKNSKGISKGTDVSSQLVSIDNSNVVLTLFYLVEIISDYVNKQIQFRKYNTPIRSRQEIINSIDMDELSKHLEKTQYSHVFKLYKNLYKLFKFFDEDGHFEKYKESLRQAIKKIDKDELTFHNKVLISYCILKKTSSRSQYFKEELWIVYSDLLSNELFLSDINQYMDTALFRSILFLGLELGFYERVKSFVNQYSTKVCPQESINMYNLGLAYYNYFISHTDKALDHLQKISMTDFIYKYDIKNLFVKIYMENGYYSSLESVLKSYTLFLRNDRVLNEESKRRFSTFIHYCNKFITLKELDKVEVSYLINKISKEDVYAKDWLIKVYSNVLSEKEAAMV
jgi:hypothetical protein